MANYHLKAEDLMQTDVVTILSDLSVANAAMMMKHHGVRSLIVEKDGDDDVYGLVTYSDIVTKVLAYGLDTSQITVSEIMTKPLVVVNRTLSLQHVAALFAKTHVGHAPVISGHQLVGVISKTDLIVEGITEAE